MATVNGRCMGFPVNDELTASTVNIEELIDESNYRTWRIQMKHILQSRGLWELIANKKHAHPRLQLQRFPDFVDSGGPHRLHEAAKIIWCSCSRDIQSALDGSNYYYHPQSLWEDLENRYEPVPVGSRHSAFMNLINMRFDGQDLQRLCDEYRSGLIVCRERGITMDHEFFIHLFIAKITPFLESYGRQLLQTYLRSQRSGRRTLPFSIEYVMSGALRAKN